MDPPGEVTLCMAISADGVEIVKNVSYTPCVGKILNLEGGLSNVLSSICLHGYFPPKIQDYNSMFRPIAEQYAKHAPGKEHILVTCAATGLNLCVRDH